MPTSNNEVSNGHELGLLPLISACFLIRFDQRIGYTIAWQRALPELKLDGVVEFKSLPSGLHNVKEDLVYFIHENQAGIAAFRNVPASEAERNAEFVSVGILVPLAHGRLGRGWLHAQQLQRLASDVMRNSKSTTALEQYWEKHQIRSESSTLDSTNEAHYSNKLKSPSHKKHRNMSESMSLGAPNKSISPYHPILAIPDFLDSLGPLIFPIYRAALLRQRILIINRPPIRKSCNYVYILSILASLPLAVSETVPEPLSRIRPLFNIGIHDIPLLEDLAKHASYSDEEAEREEAFLGWIASSSDELLSTKSRLHDVRVELPDTSAGQSKNLTWPAVFSSASQTATTLGTPIKVTQRDLRRYHKMRHALLRISNSNTDDHDDEGADADDYEDDANLIPTIHSKARSRSEASAIPHTTPQDTGLSSDKYEGAIIEPSPWAAIAYDSFIWWASAGERASSLDDEDEADSDLLRSASDVWNTNNSNNGSLNADHEVRNAGAVEVAVVAYFHRMTTVIIRVLSEIVDSAVAATETASTNAIDDSTDQASATDEPREALTKVTVYKEDLSRMGLDLWSKSDRTFVQEMCRVYFNVEADVQGAGVECCGMRIY